MANTIGYITGALSALALAAGIGYGVENTKNAGDSVQDARSSIVRTLEKPKGYIGEGNLLKVLAEAGHDLVERNPTKAWNEFDQLDVGLENTPLQDQRLASSNYRDVEDFGTYLNHKLQERWALSDYAPSGLKTKGGLGLGIAGMGLGLLTAAGLAKRP